MSLSSSPAADMWDALDSLTLRLAPFVSPSGKPSGVPGGLGSAQSSPLGDGVKPASEGALVSLLLVSSGVGVDVCGGRVGVDKVKFCASVCNPTSTSCGTASHAKKVSLISPAYYIRVPNSSYAYVQPVLPVPESGFPAIVQELLAGVRAVPAWTEIFTACMNIDTLEPEDQQDVVSRLQHIEGFDLSRGVTPMRFKKRRVDLSLADRDRVGMEIIDEATTGSWVVDSPEEPSLLPRDSAFEPKIMHIVESWDKVILTGQHHRQLTADNQADMKRYLEIVDNKIVKVVSMVGEMNMNNVPALTVWSCIEAHQDSIAEGQKTVAEIESSSKRKFNVMEGEIKDVKRVINGQIVSALQVLTDRVSSQPANGFGEGVNGQDLQTIILTLDQLKAEIAVMKEQGGASLTSSSGDELEHLRLELGSVKDELALLKVENQRLRAESNSDIIEFGGFVFNSSSSYVTWVATHLPSAYIGFCFDFVSLLECFSNQNRISEDGLKMAESIKKAGYKDKQVAVIDQSFGCTFPKVFGEEQDSSNPAKKMAKLKTVVDWDNPSANTGLKIRINTFITAYRKTIDTQIYAHLGYGSVAGNFFTTLMQHNVKFWEMLSAWITRFENELTHRAGGDNPKLHQEGTWNLICWMIHSMFVEMNIRRSPGTVLSMDDSDTDVKMEKCAAILHGTLSAHKFMGELIKDEFVRHPIFASTMDEFLLSNKAAHATVEAMLVRMKKMEERINGIQAVADKAMQEAKKGGGGGGDNKEVPNKEDSRIGRGKRNQKDELLSIDRKGKRQKLTQWGYGEGIDGYKQTRSSENQLSTLIVDQRFPWWWSAAKSLDLNIIRIWLTSYPSVGLEFIEQTWCPDSTVETGPVPSEALVESLPSTNVILCGRGIPPNLLKQRIWKNKQLYVVISTCPFDLSSEPDWEQFITTVDHARIGGVTNGLYKIVVGLRKGTPYQFNAKNEEPTILQDLRWVLKSGLEGSIAKPPTLSIPDDAVTKVVYCAKGILSHASLVPIGHLSSTVRAPGFGNQWVTRKLTVTEQLRIFDVPEQLCLLLPSIDIQSALLKTIHLPGKVCGHVLNKIFRSTEPPPDRTRKRDGVKEVLVDLPIKKQRVQKGELYPSALSHIETPYLSTKGNCRRRFVPVLPPIPETGLYLDEDSEVPLMKTLTQDVTLTAPKFVDPNQKATKRDDAEVRMELWDSRLVLPFLGWILGRDVSKALVCLRKWMLSWWRRRVLKSYIRWAQYHEITSVEQEAARDCIQRACDASWWAWDGGSRPFFWRWPSDYQDIILKGHPPWFVGKMKRWFRSQIKQTDKKIQDLITSKLQVIRNKRYIEKGKIHSLMPFFHVPKGADDIRMVYDGSANGLNAILWAPWFTLPTVDSLVRALQPGYGMADNDVGEMFHNFVLHEDVQQFCGLDLTQYFSESERKGFKYLQERWTRLAMGLRCSPYFATQAMSIAQEVILGARENEAGNIFHWHRVQLNLPGSSCYDPSKPWFCKVRRDGTIAADCFIYVDDIRSSAPTIEEAWQAAQRTSSTLAFLGIQDAARKRRSPGIEPGAWTGSVVWTSNDELSVLTTKEKWDKMKFHLLWISNNMSHPRGLDIKILKSIRGFLVYISRTYPSMVPYLKGIHLTIDSWRLGRDVDGWKMKVKHISKPDDDDTLFDSTFNLDMNSAIEPTYVYPVPRLKHDIKCLMELTHMDIPPRRKVRMNQQAQVVYGFGDASKQGFGASIELPDKRLYWRYGKWTLEREHASSQADGKIERSSNYRELRNLVEALESSIVSGDLSNCDIFMFTDNSTAEAAYNKGTSSSRLLFELVLRLRKIEMSGVCRIHLVHVAGTRMIFQGTDGLSRGDHTAGVMAGGKMIDFVPLHLPVFDRSHLVLPWILSWLVYDNITVDHIKLLEPNDWPTVLALPLIYIWTPPPSIADIAGEYMAHSIHKRPNATHIFICPRLMTSRWMRLITKATDLQFRIPVGSTVWESIQHEPLLLTIAFPLNRHRAGRYKETAECEHQRILLQEMFTKNFEASGTALRKLFTRARAVGSM